MSPAKIKPYVVIPAYNEEEVICDYLRSICDLIESHQVLNADNFIWTLLVINDGSQDATEQRLIDLVATEKYKSVRIEFQSLIRNFGHQAALLAGLKVVATKRADFAITIDADGEHPIELLPQLVEHWLRGASIVHTSRLPDERLSKFKGASSRLYYVLLRLLANLDITAGMADYKLWDGELLRSVKPFLNTCGSTRAFASWLAPKAPVVTYRQKILEGRVSRFTLRKMVSLALTGLVRYSDFPIRVAFYIGVCALIVGAILFLDVMRAYMQGITLPGWTSTVSLIIFFGGLQCFLLGIYGEYFLRNLFRTNLPTFVLKPKKRNSKKA